MIKDEVMQETAEEQKNSSEETAKTVADTAAETEKAKVETEPAVDPEIAANPETAMDPETAADPETAMDPETAADPKAAADPEQDVKSETAAASKTVADPETAEEQEAGADEKDPDTAQKKGLFGRKKKAEETVSKASYDELKSKYDDLNNQYLRLNADFQNFRRRNENTRSEAYADAKAGLITDLLGVLDNFDRALSNPTEDTKYAEGVELIHKTFLEVVTKAGLTEIEAEGKPFDPNLHNAVMKQPKEGVESDTVITVFQKGYMLNGKVLRPSMVIVAE